MVLGICYLPSLAAPPILPSLAAPLPQASIVRALAITAAPLPTTPHARGTRKIFGQQRRSAELPSTYSGEQPGTDQRPGNAFPIPATKGWGQPGPVALPLARIS